MVERRSKIMAQRARYRTTRKTGDCLWLEWSIANMHTACSQRSCNSHFSHLLAARNREHKKVSDRLLLLMCFHARQCWQIIHSRTLTHSLQLFLHVVKFFRRFLCARVCACAHIHVSSSFLPHVWLALSIFINCFLQWKFNVPTWWHSGMRDKKSPERDNT